MARVVPEFVRQRYLRTDVRALIDRGWVDAVDIAEGLGGGAVYVITAWNPEGRMLPEDENRRRSEELMRELLATGANVHEAVGESPDSGWCEASWAVTGIGRRQARRFGRTWEQDAVFEITREELRVLGCATQWTRSRRLDGASEADGSDGETLEYAVLEALGLVVEPDFRRAFEGGWEHDGDLDLPCPACGGSLHLFGADLRSRSGTDYRAMGFVCVDESSVRLPNLVPDEYRTVAKRVRALRLAQRDADELGLSERARWGYVIELHEAVGERLSGSPAWVYVGETALTPEERFAQHLEGYKASRWVRRFGVRLRPDLYLDQPVLRTALESTAYEAWLFAWLVASGYPAKGGT